MQTFNGHTFNGMTDTEVNDAQLSVGMNTGLDPTAELACLVGQQTGNYGACVGTSTETKFPYPSQTPAFADSVAADPVPYPYPTSSSGGGPANTGFVVLAAFPTDVTGGLTDRHSNGTEIAFLDGHVKWARTSAVQPSPPTSPDFSNFLANLPCVNFNAAHLYWDPTAPDPATVPACAAP